MCMALERMLEEKHVYHGVSTWSTMFEELLELILVRVSIVGLLRSSLVCKYWRSVVVSRAFSLKHEQVSSPKPWFILYCVNYHQPGQTHGYGFDPRFKEWFHTILSFPPPNHDKVSLAGNTNGLVYAITSTSFSKVCYKRQFLSDEWEQTSGMACVRDAPLLGLVETPGNSDTLNSEHQLIVAGGVVASHDDELAVEIYSSRSKSWEICESLPAEFRGSSSRHWLTSVVLSRKFYALEITTGHAAALDLDGRKWSKVRSLSGYGVIYSYLLACQNRLLLAGLCKVLSKESFKIWGVDEDTLECLAEIGSMPAELLNNFGISEGGGERKGERLQCVVCGNAVYVFSLERYRNYPVIACELDCASSAGVSCTWYKLPPLPSNERRYNNVVGVCASAIAPILPRV